MNQTRFDTNDCVFCFAEEPIHIALLLPMSGRSPRGLLTDGAAAFAVKRVNANKTLLPRHVLEYNWADSGCSAKQGLAAMGKLLAGESNIKAVIGPGCSPACEVTGYLSGGQNLPQISHSCSSPALSDKHEYPLVRLHLKSHA